MCFSLGSIYYSQVKFHLKPSIQMKTNQSSINSDNYPVNYSNSYFSFYNRRIFFSSAEINYGLSLGASLSFFFLVANMSEN